VKVLAPRQYELVMNTTVKASSSYTGQLQLQPVIKEEQAVIPRHSSHIKCTFGAEPWLSHLLAV
jgi:hypothetical protein